MLHLAVLPNVTEVSLDPVGSNAAEEDGSAAGTETALSEHVLGNGMKVVIREDTAFRWPMPAWPSRPAAVRRMNMTPG